MNILRKLKTSMGYIWAALCFLLVLATFVGLNFWERTLVSETGIHVSPRFSGGEVRQVMEHGTYRTLLHRVVFDGLVGERGEGFVQIDWIPQDKNKLPPVIQESFDLDGNGSAEFAVRMDTSTSGVQLDRRASWILEPEPLIAAGSERILRVRLQNKKKR